MIKKIINTSTELIEQIAASKKVKEHKHEFFSQVTYSNMEIKKIEFEEMRKENKKRQLEIRKKMNSH